MYALLLALGLGWSIDYPTKTYKIDYCLDSKRLAMTMKIEQVTENAYKVRIYRSLLPSVTRTFAFSYFKKIVLPNYGKPYKCTYR